MGRNANTLEFEAIVSISTISYMALLRILNCVWNMVALYIATSSTASALPNDSHSTAQSIPPSSDASINSQ